MQVDPIWIYSIFVIVKNSTKVCIVMWRQVFQRWHSSQLKTFVLPFIFTTPAGFVDCSSLKHWKPWARSWYSWRSCDLWHLRWAPVWWCWIVSRMLWRPYHWSWNCSSWSKWSHVILKMRVYSRDASPSDRTVPHRTFPLWHFLHQKGFSPTKTFPLLFYYSLGWLVFTDELI